MATITTGNFAKALWPGVNSWYGQSYNEHKVEWTDLFDTYKSNRNYEEDMGITSFGLASAKPEGSAITYDEERQGFLTRYTHVVYGNGFIVTREMVEDDLYSIVAQKRAKGLAYSMRQTKETVASNVFNRAFNSSFVGGDGVELCSTAHVNVAGGTWGNELATSADLSEASLEQACIDIGRWTDLTDADAWFLKTDVADGMKCYQRRPLQFAIDNDFDTENAKFKAVERYSFGWTDPRAIYGSPGA